MKKIFTLLIGCVFSITIITAQDAPPQAFSYKATIMKANGNAPLANKTISLRINILTSTGASVYEETFNPTTNKDGQIDISIGRGGIGFSSIEWSTGEFFLKTEVDVNGGTNYQPLSETQLLSVPYALHSKTVEIGNWGTDVVKTDGTLDGQGTVASPLKIADNAVTSAKIDDATIVSADLADNAVITSKINNGAVTMEKIHQTEATAGQALKWDGAKWSPGNDLIGTPGGTSGTVQFNNAGVLDGDANFFWDNTSKRLGLGTSILYAPLTVKTAYNTGIYVESTASNGVGIEGAGNLYGVFGILNSDNGSAIYGLSRSTIGNTNGVFGVSDSPNSGVGVKGIASSRSGSNFGVYGASHSSIGIGIYGVNEATSGSSTGIVGQVSSSEGTAIKGQALSSSGITYGIKGTVMSPDGYSGYFYGGKFCVFGNVGLGNINPNFKLDVNGNINLTGELYQNGNPYKISWSEITNTPTTIAGYGITDADGSITNEIQVLSLSENNLTLSKGGGSVSLPTFSGDNWGTQSVVKDGTLEGNGTSSTPLKIAQQSATQGQVLKWSGTTWSPGTDLSGSSLWSQNGSNIYFNGGYVGIGNNQPSYRLDVNGNIRVDGSVRADKLLIPTTEQYYSIAGCTFNPTSNTSYIYSRDINCIVINPNQASGDADLVAPVHIPSGATLEYISALVLDNGPATITVSLYLVTYSGGKFNLGSTNSSVDSSSPQNLGGSLNSTVDNNNNAFVVVVRCNGEYNSGAYYRIYKVKIRYTISALP